MMVSMTPRHLLPLLINTLKFKVAIGPGSSLPWGVHTYFGQGHEDGIRLVNESLLSM